MLNEDPNIRLPDVERHGIKLMCGDCLERLKEVPDKSIDLVLCDPPYGTTSLKWDEIIPLEPLWKELKRVLTPKGGCVFTCFQPFTTVLINSNRPWFRYCWVWNKQSCGNPFVAPYQPLRTHEDVAVFYRKGAAMVYNPQGVVDLEETSSRAVCSPQMLNLRGDKKVHVQKKTRYPKSIVSIKREGKRSGMHPTQKPVELMRYFIETFTNPDARVLDFSMGSGTTGVAAVESGREFVGIELDRHWYDVAASRIFESIEEKRMETEMNVWQKEE